MSCLDEDTVRTFVDGSLDETARTKADSHIAGCPTCADRVAALGGARPAASEAPALARGVTVGRYVIVDLVGRGGMGEVYAAYDPQLDRKVALKLLHQTSAAGARHRTAHARLLREAKAMARLSHPNVVVAHDAGVIDDRVFLAMEFIDGQTLATWLRSTPRSWREIRDAFAAAGDGLAAAHDAGLVHRDFKPQNVMVARDGSVRVMDFGLASDSSTTVDDDVLSALPTGDASAMLTVAQTAAGTLLGTPNYMAPEQFLAQATDARTDQFSFCVALYEALYGQRPFPSGELAAVAKAVTSGSLYEPTRKARVPAAMRRLLLRGLSLDPDDRYPSMRALLGDLRRDPARRRRVAGAASAGLALVAAAAFGAQHLATRGQRLCMTAGNKMAEVWELGSGGTRREAIRRAFVATGAGFAEGTWKRVSDLLDDYSRRWTRGYTQACEATHVRGEQPPEVLGMRLTCLEERRDALRALTDVFARADTAVLVQAVNAAQELPPVERCGDVTLAAGAASASDPARRAEIAAHRAALAEVKALSDTGQLPTARRRVATLVDAARATGHRALIAEVLERRAWLEERTGDAQAAAATSEEALWAALAARRDDIALVCAAQLQAIAGYHLDQSRDGERWGRLGEVLLGRLGPGYERAAAWLVHNRGMIRERHHDFHGALADYRAGLALKLQVLPPNHPDIGASWGAIGPAQVEMGDYAGALASSEKVLDIYRLAYGDDSPLLAHPLGNRGEVLALLGRHGDAQRDLRASIERWSAFVSADHPWVAYALTALGKDLVADGRSDEAIAPLERAVAIRDRAEPKRELAAESRFALAQARWEANRSRAEARALAVAARDGYRKLAGYGKRAAEIDGWLAARK